MDGLFGLFLCLFVPFNGRAQMVTVLALSVVVVFIVIAWAPLLPSLVNLLEDPATDVTTLRGVTKLLNLWRATEHPNVEVGEHLERLTRAREQRPSEHLDTAICVLSNQSLVSRFLSQYSTENVVHTLGTFMQRCI